MNGGIQCWGSNDYGQLGISTPGNQLVPVPVTGLASGVLRIGLGAYHGCAINAAGNISCWGNNANGELGFPFRSLVPLVITGPWL